MISGRLRAASRRVGSAMLGVAVLVALLALGALGAAPPASANAAGNASAAFGFVERAQNTDGGFGAKLGAASDPEASLWAAVGLLSAGKHPDDEVLIGGDSLLDYLEEQASSYDSLTELGLLTIVQAKSENVSASSLGNPADRLAGALTASAATANPDRGAIGVIGLSAAGGEHRTQARTVAEALLDEVDSASGGWSGGSATTALVLQALSPEVTGVAGVGDGVVDGALAALKKVQINDGSIAASLAANLNISQGDVAATAFTAQAQQALGSASFTASQGKTVLDGLVSYQHPDSGGLQSGTGWVTPGFTPSVRDTAQALTAFNGKLLAPESVVSYQGGQERAPYSDDDDDDDDGDGNNDDDDPGSDDDDEDAEKKPKRVSKGTGSDGISGDRQGAEEDTGAGQGAQATGGAGGTGDGSGDGDGDGDGNGTGTGTGGDEVSGTAVNQVPQLVTAAGEEEGLSESEKAAIALGAVLAAALLLGALGAARRQRLEQRSAVAVGIQATSDAWSEARVRGALAPAAAVIIGAALVLAPFATDLFPKAEQGATMLAAFEPHMNEQSLAEYQRNIDVLDAGVTEALERGPELLYPDLDEAEAQQEFAADQPLLAPLAETWPQINTDFQNLIGTVTENLGNFLRVAALPFASFPWFFLIPGGLLVLIGLAALIPTFWKKRSWPVLRWAALAVGIALVAAPSAVSLWDRAPAGAQLIEQLASIENDEHVTEIQNHFGQLTTASAGLSSLRSQLREEGLSDEKIAEELPGVVAFGDRWVQVTQDFTPLLGALSDNVGNYEAVASLPNLGIFPWLFAGSGLLLILIVLGSIWRTRRRRPKAAAAPPGDATLPPEAWAAANIAPDWDPDAARFDRDLDSRDLDRIDTTELEKPKQPTS